MNKQEIFTKVKNHLLTQMERSIIGNSCKYRGPNGLMCAVGCLIPDEFYDPEMEGRDALSVLNNYPEVAKLLNESNFHLLNELQYIHDNCEVSNWESGLRQLAVEENLEF